jgi:phospholipid/cholesterol/gamma-HCH transport system substrate-binding protein
VPPLASGPATATYDQNGKFVDPAGGTGVFAPGAEKLAPAENWVDLMLAPRQA